MALIVSHKSSSHSKKIIILSENNRKEGAMKQNFFEQNRIALKENQIYFKENIIENRTKTSTILVEYAKNGSKIVGIEFFKTMFYFNSRYNPEEDAQLYIEQEYDSECEMIFLIGLEFAYHAKELQKKITKKQKIVIIETNIDIFYAALENIDLSGLFSDKRVVFFVYQDTKSYSIFIENIVKDSSIFSNPKSILTIILPQYMQVEKKVIDNIMETTDYCIKHLQATRNTIMDISDIWLENYLENAKYLENSIPVEEFFNQFKGIPAYIVSAGPSLSKNIIELKKIKKDGIIFAGYTVLDVLLKHDIIPDFVVTIDGRQLIHESLEQQQTTFHIPLIYSAFTDKRLLKKHKGIKIKQVLPYDEYSKFLNLKLNKFCKPIYTAGTVAATIMDIAYHMGCRPIVFVGQDLAFTNNKTHVSGTYYENEADYEEEFIHRKDSIKIKDITGKEIKTNYIFMQYKKGIEDYIDLKREVCEFIDATEGGAYIRGSTVCSLADVISNYKNNNIVNVMEKIDEIKNQTINKKEEIKLNDSYMLQNIQASFKELNVVCNDIKQALNEIEILLQEKERNKENKEYPYLERIIEQIEGCNKKIDGLNKNTKLFQLAILGKMYKTEREHLTLGIYNRKEEFLVFQSISFFEKIIELYEKFKSYSSEKE